MSTHHPGTFLGSLHCRVALLNTFFRPQFASLGPPLEQNINGNIQNGECIIKYPKKKVTSVKSIIRNIDAAMHLSRLKYLKDKHFLRPYPKTEFDTEF